MVILNDDGSISLGNLQDYLLDLEDLQERAEVNNPEDNIRIFARLKQIAMDLEDPHVMQLPYARQYYPRLFALINQIRQQLETNNLNFNGDSKSLKLFYHEK